VNRCDEFYLKRDQRTNEYLGAATLLAPEPVHVSIGEDAAFSRAGQVAAISLVNLLARVHRTITLDLPTRDIPLLTEPDVEGEGDLSARLLGVMRAADPCGSFLCSNSLPDRGIAIGLGKLSNRACSWFIGARNAIAILSKQPEAFGESDGTIRGAGLAACLGSAALFRAQLGLETAPRVLSAWNYEEGARAEEGPTSLNVLDVGRVLMVGGGAVGSCLAYWLRLFGVSGEWVAVDRDEVAIHNLNRSLLFTAADSGWPDGVAHAKCDVIARALSNVVPVPEWYDEYILRDSSEFDVVLCLANDREVRHLMSCRNYSVLLHATTGTNWLSQLHRHIAGIDDCVFCRVGEILPVMFGCSTGEVVNPAGERSDAALPFLSAASGLMLATALQRLQEESLASLDVNDWRWDFGSPHKMAGKGTHVCSETCSRVSSSTIRRRLHVTGRWKHLDR
jgi:molybdopterin/thiamine biosynthesis adenylyltransferase